jgi:hypothetical protein
MNASEALACVTLHLPIAGNPLGVSQYAIYGRHADPGAPGDLGAL